ncbi:MAG: OmpA family protein, partial [Proteobacteria bacterium]|nr:OmpA family protein [Pseudomonadota bacterium]
MKKILISLGLVLSVSFAMGCASQEPATDLLKDAAAAMANTGNAKECAAETYALAQNALKEAQAAQEAGDLETARQKARLAQTLAKQAKEEAEMNAEECERRKNASAAVEEILNDELSGGPVFVRDDSFKVIYFDFDESFLSSSAVQDLQSNVAVLKAKPEMNVILAAHTDDRGTTEYNLALSQRRGDAVKAHAVSLGVDASRMSVVPYGKEMPASHGT